MKSNKLWLVFCSIGLLAASCTSSKKAGHSGDSPSLKEVFKKDFVMGTAVNTG